MSASGVCPDCAEDLQPNASTCRCGWRAKPKSIATSGERAKVRDPDWWRCCYVDRGDRCEEAGGISPSTHGGGPWYCGNHYQRLTSPFSRSRPPSFQTLRAVVESAPDIPKRARAPLPVLDATYDEGEAERTAINAMLADEREADNERAAIEGEGA